MLEENRHFSLKRAENTLFKENKVALLPNKHLRNSTMNRLTGITDTQKIVNYIFKLLNFYLDIQKTLVKPEVKELLTLDRVSRWIKYELSCVYIKHILAGLHL